MIIGGHGTLAAHGVRPIGAAFVSATFYESVRPPYVPSRTMIVLYAIISAS
jgi:hypothetical protein